jgi:uncharacterized protein
MNYVIGFLIALAVGLTGIGGGSFTVPALVLLVGLPAGAAVGTAFVYAGVLRLIASPFYLVGRHVHWRYLWQLLKGAVPGLFIGTVILRLLSSNTGSPVVVILLGVVLTASSSITFIPRAQNREFAQKNPRVLPWLALPIGVEAGFSSAGAGALGTVLLLNYSDMTPPEVVGTDIMFGLVLAVLGSAFHWKFGAISNHVLTQLLEGGVPGVVIGCIFARRVPARKLKLVIALIAIFAGLQLIWSGAQTLVREPHAKTAGPLIDAPVQSIGLATGLVVLLKVLLNSSLSRNLPSASAKSLLRTQPAAQISSHQSIFRAVAFPYSMACCSAPSSS